MVICPCRLASGSVVVFTNHIVFSLSCVMNMIKHKEKNIRKEMDKKESKLD